MTKEEFVVCLVAFAITWGFFAYCLRTITSAMDVASGKPGDEA